MNTHGATVNRGEIVSMYAGLNAFPFCSQAPCSSLVHLLIHLKPGIDDRFYL